MFCETLILDVILPFVSNHFTCLYQETIVMDRPKVFVTRNYHPEAVNLLEQEFDVEVWDTNIPPPREVILDKVTEVQGMMTEAFDSIDREVVETAATLRVVANRAVGTDNFDVVAASNKGILLANTPGILHETCADMTFALMLGVARRVVYADRQVRAGAWKVLDQSAYLGFDVNGKILGIVGIGQIAQAVIKRAIGFNMEVIYFSRTRRPEIEHKYGIRWVKDVSAILSESDFVSMHVPLTTETRGILGINEFKKMKKSAILVNTSRGPVVDSLALYQALSNGLIAGAGLDVVDPEPMPPDHPLLTFPNVVVTPHIASASTTTFSGMAIMAAENIIAALNGKKMPSCINSDLLLRDV